MQRKEEKNSNIDAIKIKDGSQLHKLRENESKFIIPCEWHFTHVKHQ